MDANRIEIRGLRFEAVHGVLESERCSAQPFEVDLDLAVDTALAARTDDLGDTVDYVAVVACVRDVLAGPPRCLLERLAGDVVDRVLALPGVRGVTVALRKLAPPIETEVASVGVRVSKSRGGGR